MKSFEKKQSQRRKQRIHLKVITNGNKEVKERMKITRNVIMLINIKKYQLFKTKVIMYYGVYISYRNIMLIVQNMGGIKCCYISSVFLYYLRNAKYLNLSKTVIC